ncbi:MAG: hypothetical protein IH961_07385, partial [Chloroflexi bacterium]|nr:hypothetical protein [Chloroflexota bacterium]
MKWEGLHFETVEELVREACCHTTKPVTVDQVEALFSYQPPYDGYDLRELLEHLGWKPRPKRFPLRRLLRLADEVRMNPPPGFDNNSFLDELRLNLQGDDRRKAAEIIGEAVSRRVRNVEPLALWPSLMRRLGLEFTDWQLLPPGDWEGIDDAFHRACRKHLEGIDDQVRHNLALGYWQEARRIA